jgi:hypothetical protein
VLRLVGAWALGSIVGLTSIGSDCGIGIGSYCVVGSGWGMDLGFCCGFGNGFD